MSQSLFAEADSVIRAARRWAHMPADAPRDWREMIEAELRKAVEAYEANYIPPMAGHD